MTQHILSIAGLLGATIFMLLSVLHFHWALGGKYGYANSLPMNEKGETVLHPKKRDSAIVGFGLFSFSIIYLVKSELLNINLPSIVSNYGLWLIVVIFLLRAVGDFKYVGFFKKIRFTNFAEMDSKFYAPLCLFLAFIGVFIELYN